ncbi:hypothetical protein [Photobacterium kishitanii]|uniref:hypothetical protein n=1 Tax=Photobacterium kishitanii TaxID=318456 RepID=UPI0007F93660|nr:hypothetical protein [Photobacterium kishitanii]OBU33863.1 hypothetical protein AYY23_13600 [Photobacterium kishitanii]PSW47127.1 hypothetical protein C0W66_19735 [Photobacterium kishitanii]
MNPIDVINSKKQHLARYANQNGSNGELITIESNDNWIPRPKGNELKLLLSALEETGISIKRSSFDALSIPKGVTVDFNDLESIKGSLSQIVFIEIKSANQDRVKEDFTGFFFALTENEIKAAEALGNRHQVALFNKKTSEILMTTVSEIINRAKSSTWQVSVQL